MIGKVILDAIDAINAEDPTHIEFAGSSGPKELVHAQRMSYWLGRLVAHPSDAQRIAARAHHLRRWAYPRTDYPDGRSGYLRWRAAARRRHVAETAELIGDHGGDDSLITEVSDIISKNAEQAPVSVQAQEDALCLTFCELQLDEMLEHLGRERTVEIVAKTIHKMSSAAIALAGEAMLSAAARSVLGDGLERGDRRAAPRGDRRDDTE